MNKIQIAADEHEKVLFTEMFLTELCKLYKLIYAIRMIWTKLAESQLSQVESCQIMSPVCHQLVYHAQLWVYGQTSSPA